jgi:hypothetical protein
VHGGQRRVLAYRSLELGSLVGVAVLLLVVDGGAVWAPVALAFGPVLTAAAVRQRLLVPASLPVDGQREAALRAA